MKTISSKSPRRGVAYDARVGVENGGVSGFVVVAGGAITVSTENKTDSFVS